MDALARTARALIAAGLLTAPLTAQLDPGEVLDEVLIDGAALGAALEIGDGFGEAIAALGDVDGDGVGDVAIGAPGDGPGNRGAVWIVLLNPNGTVRGATRLASGSAGIPTLDPDDAFGSAVAPLGDLDEDGVPDVAIGAPGDDGDDAGFSERGAVWIAYLNEAGAAKAVVKLADGTPGLGALPPHGSFGDGLAYGPDVDGDGVDDLFVGATSRSLLGDGKGKGYLLSLGPAGEVFSSRVYDENDVPGGLVAGDLFGSAAAFLGDLDGDEQPSLAIASRGANGGYGFGAGRVTLYELDGNGNLTTPIDLGVNGELNLAGGDQFGSSLAAIGDLDGDGVADLLVGSDGDDDGGTNLGAVRTLFLASNGEVAGTAKISALAGGFAASLPDFARFGSGLAAPDDLNGDGVVDLLVGARGAAASWLLFLQGAKELGPEPFPPLTPAAEGRPGRASLALPPAPDIGDDKIDDPVVGVPGLDKTSVTIQSPLLGPEQSVAFVEIDEVPTGSGPSQALTGDFNGDGRDDIVTANSGSDSISYLEATGPSGPGFFDPAAELDLPVGFTPISIATADFDGDGENDVVAAGPGGLAGFAGDGTGAFTPLPAIPFVDLLTDVVAGDVDGDGDVDLVTASGAVASGGLEEGFVTVLLNDGAANFSTFGTFATGQAVVSVLLGDFDDTDGLGALDALVAVHGLADPLTTLPVGRIELWLGDDTGAYTKSTVFADVVVTDADGSHPTYGVVDDIDFDGDLDAVYTTNDNIAYAPEVFDDAQTPLVVTTLLNDGAGDFAVFETGTAYSGKGVTPILLDLAPEPANALDLIIVWWQDLLAGTTGSDDQTFLAFLVGQGDGTFFDPAPNQFLTGEEPGNGDSGDVDGSADVAMPDLLIPSLKDNSFTVFVNQGDFEFTPGGTFGPVDDFVAPAFFEGGPWDLRLVDLDDDELLDVVVHNLWENQNPLPMPGDLLGAQSVTTYVGDGAGGFTRVDYEPLAGVGEMTTVDLDIDGRDEVVVTERGRDAPAEQVRVLVNGGVGDLTPSAPIAAPAGTTLDGGIATADLNGDGRPDVVTAGTNAAGEGVLLVFPNVAGAALGAPAVFPLGVTWGDVRSIEVDLFDDDETLDVAIGCVDGGLILASGVATTDAIDDFVVLVTDPIAADVGGGALRVGDVNGDGRRDVVASSAGAAAGEVSQAQVHSLVASLEVGAFDVETVAGTASAGVLGALRPVLDDLNADGALDLVLIHGTSSAVSILPNQLNTFETFGIGKAGSGGVTPTLSGFGYTTPGGALALTVDEALGGALALLIASSDVATSGPPFQQVGTPLASLMLMLDGTPDAIGAGTTTISTRFDPEPALVGLEYVVQVFVADPGATPSPELSALLGVQTKFSATQGLRFTIVQ